MHNSGFRPAALALILTGGGLQTAAAGDRPDDWPDDRPDDRPLAIRSSTPNVAINARAGDRTAIGLPDLEYTFHIDARCSSGQRAESVLISIADTRRRLPRKDLLANAAAGVAITVPAKQIAPLTIYGFCVQNQLPDQASPTRVTVRGALSAQASLLCTGDDEQSMSYASAGLDVTLLCLDDEASPDADDPPATDGIRHLTPSDARAKTQASEPTTPSRDRR